MIQKTRPFYPAKGLVIIQYILAFAVWIYIIYRAFSFEIVHDEFISYNLLKRNYWNALAGTYNTHWLNSAFMKCVMLLPGADSVWKLRMLSVLAWPVFALVIIKLSDRFNNRFTGWLFYCACIFNPLLILYFSLARGYALMCLFAAVTLWYLCRLTSSREPGSRKWLSVFIPAALAVLANFSALYFFLGLSAVYAAHMLLTGNGQPLQQKEDKLLAFLLPVTIVVATSVLLFIKFYTKEAETSGGDGFIGGLFVSQIAGAKYKLPDILLSLTAWCWFLLVMIAIVFSGWRVFIEKKTSLLFFVSWSCAVVFLLNFFFHAFLHTIYLSERRALFSYCLLVFTAAELLNQPWFNNGYKKIAIKGCALLLSACILLNAGLNINTHHFSEWSVQPKTKDALDYLLKAGARKVGLDTWQYSITMRYYSLAYPGKYPFEFAAAYEYNVSGPLPKNDVFDYLVLSSAPADTSGNWRVVWQAPGYGTTILKSTAR